MQRAKNEMERIPTIRIVLLPRDTNGNGTIFGGIILSHIDLAGAVEAKKNTRGRVVTVAMKEVIFKHPVYVGELISFYTSTTKLGNSSIGVHVDVEVDRENAVVHVTSADMTFVSVDLDGRPVPLER
jgi:acyl-CoA thioesterase YciA